MSNLCFACKKPHNLTVEHIIPQAIGGRLKAKLYCAECNSAFGSELDAEITKQLGWVGNCLQIGRERGKLQPFEVEELTSGTKLIADGQSLKRKDPTVKKKLDGTKLDYADIVAPSEKERDKIRASIQKRYKVSGKGKSFQINHPGPTYVKHSPILSNPKIRRAVSKIAYGFLCTKLPQNVILSSPFDAIRHYIKTGSGSTLTCLNFIHTGFMTDGKRALHKIHIILNRGDRLVIGYVSLFSICRFTVLLAENYESGLEWPGMDYTFDPVRSEEIFGNDYFRAPALTKDKVLQPRQSKRFMECELKAGYKIIENYNHDFKVFRTDLHE